MTQREELLNSDHWAEYEKYIRSGGQDPCLRESFLIRHITALTLRIQELEQREQWRKFDKEDRDSWPKQTELYWTCASKGAMGPVVELSRWYAYGDCWEKRANQFVTFWQVITIPSPPESKES